MGNLIKPCPFCGSNNTEHDYGGVIEIHGHDYQSVWIECLDCNARIEGDTCDGIELNRSVVERWNSRST